MNPLTNVKNIQKLNQRELELGVIGKKSWHDEYKDSAWIFIGGLPYDLTEGDIITVFSQYGEVVNINLVRDKTTGKSKGFAFLCYEDQRSTVLAVDNLNSIKLLGRVIRVDHVSDYKKPKEKGDEDAMTLQLRAEGCAPKVHQTQASLGEPSTTTKHKKVKKNKAKKKKKKKMKVTVKVEQQSDTESSSNSSDENSDDSDKHQHHSRKQKSQVPLDYPEKIKREKEDHSYDSAVHGHRKFTSHSEKERENHERHRKPDHTEMKTRDGRDDFRDHHYRDEQSDLQKRRMERTDRDQGERSEYRHNDRDESRDRYSHKHRDTSYNDRRDKQGSSNDCDRRHR